MSWQDIVLTIANIIFSAALIPQVYLGFVKKEGPITYQTSISTFISLYVIAFTYFSLGLTFATITCLFSGTMWFLLFLQRYIYKK